MAKHRKRRLPKLSEKPEPGTGRYYTSYRGEDGKPRRKRFSADRGASEIAYHRWVVEYFDEEATITVNGIDAGSADKSLPVIANAYVQHEKNRVRPDGGRRVKGTISQRVSHDNKRQVVAILRWCKERFGDRLKTESFDRLMTATDYEALMLHFAGRLSDSQINKHRQRFWEIVRFAKRAPFEVVLPFDRDDVRKFGGTETRKQRMLPTVKMIQDLLKAATLRQRLWIWMGLGLGFGNDDLARARSIHFDKDSYDMSRGKTGFQRYGEMRPMVWAWLQAYLKENPREEDEPLFVTRTGEPLVWVKSKTEDELINGVRSRLPTETPYKRSDAVAQSWKRLKKRAGLEDWEEGFYVWRHLGATAYAARPGTGIAQLRTFLGHGKSDAADEYLKPLTPATKKVVAWVNKVLDASNADAWKKKV